MSSVKWNCQNISIFFHNAVWPTKKWRERGSSMRKLRDNSLLTAAGKFEDRTSYTSDFVPKDMSKRQVGVFCVHWKPYFKYMIWKKAFVVVCPYMYAFVCVSILAMSSFRSRSSYILDSLVSQFCLKNSIELSSFLFLTISFEWSI